MSSATYLPRCPHRVATTNSKACLLLLLVSLCSFATATKSLHGQELLDYRLVDPASHMQPWPDDEADILIEPLATDRLATKPRTDRNDSREEKSTSPTLIAELPKVAKELPEPVLEEFAENTNVPEKAAEKVEVLDAPELPSVTSPQAMPKSPASSHGCYQAPPLAAMSVSIALPEGKLPTDAAALCGAQNPPTGDARLIGAWPCIEHHWCATCMHHRPLYFEEINAERYGYTVSYALQPVISAAKFFATIPALPYKMVVERPRDCIYTLGHYRPGSCAPRRCNRLPLEIPAGAVETGVIAGLILLIP